MRTLLVAGALIAGIAGAIVWWCTGGSPAPSAQTAAPPIAAPAARTEPATAPVAPAAAERTLAAEDPHLEHVLRGRAVDGAGRPLGGVTAVLLGWSGDPTRAAAWRERHPEPQRIETSVATAADGVFTFRLWPPPPFQFALGLEGRGIATWGRRWRELAPGGATDLGDVELERGTLLRGRVADTGGAGVANVELRVDGSASTPGDGLERWTSAVTGDDGTFAARWALGAGEYRLGIADRAIERPATVVLTGEPEQTVDVIVQPAEAPAEIRGIVVDEDGAPIHRAAVVAQPGGAEPVLTGTDGRFCVRKAGAGGDTTVLTASKNGYEQQPRPVPVPLPRDGIAWGRSDVRIVLTRGLDLTVFVVRAADERPVEDYVLHVVGESGYPNGRGQERGSSPHAGGREVVKGLRTGRYDVVVEPGGDTLAAAATTVDVAAGVAQVTLRLPAIQQRALRVVFADGAAAAGIPVRLIELREWKYGFPVSYLFLERPLDGVGGLLELAKAVTGADGACTLRLPSDRPLALLLPGPGHTPRAMLDVVFPDNGPLVVTVGRGGALRGRVGPERALQTIMRNGAASTDAWLELHRGEMLTRERFPPTGSCTIDDTGSFELTGIPPGRWNATVHWRSNGMVLRGYPREEPAGTVDIVEGKTTEATLDLSSMLPGEVGALVLHNGEPLAGAMVTVFRVEHGRPEHRATLTSDAAGRVRVSLLPGEYRAAWVPRHGTGFAEMRAIEPIVAVADTATQQTLTIVSGTAKLRLVDAAGAPVANTKIGLTTGGGGAHVDWTAPTDADGRAQIVGPPGEFTACVLRKNLQTADGLVAFYRSGALADPAAMAKARRPLGTITIRAAGTTEVELTVPADW